MSTIHRSMAPALSFNGGFVDTIGFLALQGLFTAHVTGNFVTLGVSIVHGTSGALAKLLALPVFAVVVGLSHLAAVSINRRGLTPLRPLLILHAVLLALFGALAIALGPFSDGDSASALITGMTGVAAMAIQNAISRQHLKGAPPTTLMTGNVTQGAIDVFALIGLRDQEERRVIKQRLRPVALNLLGFTVGCIGAALLYLAIGLWCLSVPVLVAIWTCIRTFGSSESLS